MNAALEQRPFSRRCRQLVRRYDRVAISRQLLCSASSDASMAAATCFVLPIHIPNSPPRATCSPSPRRFRPGYLQAGLKLLFRILATRVLQAQLQSASSAIPLYNFSGGKETPPCVSGCRHRSGRFLVKSLPCLRDPTKAFRYSNDACLALLAFYSFKPRSPRI